MRVKNIQYNTMLYDLDFLSRTTDDVVVEQQKENKHVENIYWLLSWETVQQEVGIVWVMRHRSLRSCSDPCIHKQCD